LSDSQKLYTALLEESNMPGESKLDKANQEMKEFMIRKMAQAEGRFNVAEFLARCDQERQGGLTALHHAAILGEIEVINYMLKKGVNINCRADNRDTPLHSAISLADKETGSDGQLEIVKILLNNGADVNSRGSHGFSPLHVAVARNNKRLVEYLVDNAAQLNLKTDGGHTPYILAKAIGNHDIAKYLECKGADIKIGISKENIETDYALSAILIVVFCLTVFWLFLTGEPPALPTEVRYVIWLIAGELGFISFGMMLNKTKGGLLSLTIIVGVALLSIYYSLKNDLTILPPLLCLLITFLFGGMGKKVDRQCLDWMCQRKDKGKRVPEDWEK